MNWLRAKLRAFWYLFVGERERNDYLAQYFRALLALVFGKKSYVRESWPGEQALRSKHVAVFVHYDKYGKVHDFVLAYLDALAKAKRRIIFVTNSPKFPESERTKLKGRVDQIIWRHNKGYDFGAYADGIKAAGDLQKLESLLICNDSVYGPVFDLQPLFSRMDPKQADVWAMTDSWDTRYHMQSYFLLFHKAAICHEFFSKRWEKYLHVQSKSWVIRKHEIGLTADAQRHGLKTRALYRYRDLLSVFIEKIGDAKILEDESLTPTHRHVLGQIFAHAEQGSPLNASHFFWDQLLMSGFPFIKREVLQSNPMGLPSLYKWELLLKEISDYDTEKINAHLETSLRGRFI